MKLHLISGLPRSGSTLLSGILRQNPRFRAAIQSPLADVFGAALRAMSAAESAMFISSGQRRRVLSSIVESFYGHIEGQNLVVFDSNRTWCNILPAVAELLPGTRVVVCIRSPAWIIDSIERLVQNNPLTVSRMFNYEIGSIYTRVESLATKHFLAPSLNALRQAWHGDQANLLVAVRYDSLVTHPAAVMRGIYRELGEESFEHDYGSVDYSEPDFDNRVGLPGLHTVAGPVAPRPRRTILPADLFALYDQQFWAAPDGNPKGVVVL